MHVMRKLVCALVAFAFVAVIAPCAAFADETVTVASIDDFAALAERVASGDTMKGVTVQQVADVDFSNAKGWYVPIGTADIPFEGTFDGQGHTISNAQVYKLVNGVETTYLGLFGRARGATFQNMVIRDLNVWIHMTSKAYESMLCPVMESCIVDNCDIQGAVGAESGNPTLYMGALCTDAVDCTITNTKVSYERGVKDRDQFSPSYPSALLARNATRCTIANCSVTGTITGAGSVNTGGLVGTLVESSIDSCISDVSITSSVSANNSTGGLVGYAEKSSVSNCVNKSVLACTGGSLSGYVGGLVGLLGKGSSLERCENEGAVSVKFSISSIEGAKNSDMYAAGLVGVVSGNSTIAQCVNSGAVTSELSIDRHARNRAGGLVGKGSYAIISDCYNIAEVHIAAQTTAKGWFDSICAVGGIAAVLDDQVDVRNCYNAGILTSEYLSQSDNDPQIDGICPIGDASYMGCRYYRCACETASKHGEVLTAIDMMKADSFAGWDFAGTWKMDEDSYLMPVLQWEQGSRDALLAPETVLGSLSIAPIANQVYTGQPLEPELVVTGDGMQLVRGVDYLVAYGDNVNAGKASVFVEGWGAYLGQGSATFSISKADNPMTAKAAKTKFKKNKKKAQTTTITVTGAQGKVKFSSSSKKVKVNAKGKVTIAKGFSGKAKVTVKAAGNANYAAGSKVITVQVK